MKKISLVAVAWTAVLQVACVSQARAQSVSFAPLASEPGSPALMLRAIAGVERDSNILRSSSPVSDELGVLAAGLRLDKRYSLQHVTLDAQATRVGFRDFSNLDYSTFTYHGAWDFQFTPKLQGVVSAVRRQYRDITNATLGGGSIRLRTEREEFAQASLVGRGGWRTLAGLAHTRSRSDDPRSLEASPSVTSVHVGGAYEFATGASLTAQVRRGDGEYGPGLAGAQFHETEPSVRLHWPATAKTTFDARFGHLDRSHDTASVPDLKGFVGNSVLRWTYSPRTSLEAGLARDLGSYEFIGGGQIRGWRSYIAPAWRPSAVTQLRFRHAYESRQWRVQSTLSPDVGREDRVRWNELALEWTPQRLVQVTASARHERRHSSLPGLGFRGNVVGIAARLNF